MKRFACWVIVVGLVALLVPAVIEAQSIDLGEVPLELAAAGSPSSLGVDVSQLVASLCSVAPTIRDPKLLVMNDGGHTGRTLVLAVGAATESGGGTILSLQVSPVALHVQGPSPLATPCGNWDYSLTLDAGRSAPPSPLTLLRSSASEVAGAFTAVVTVPAALELRPQGGGASQWRFYTLTLNAAGTWGLAPTSAGLRGSTPISNVVLFAQQGRSLWMASPQAVQQSSLEDPSLGLLFLQPTAEALGRLNASQP